MGQWDKNLPFIQPLMRRCRRAVSVAGAFGILGLVLVSACSSPPDESSASDLPTSRLIVLGIDGLDPDVVQTLIDEGKTPNFERLANDGVFGVMDSAPPLLSPIIWTTIATGRTPSEHGIGHFTTVDPVSGEEQPVTGSLRRVKAVWNLFSEAAKKVAVVGWWATWPAEEVEGVIVSDHAGYHFLMGDQADGSATGDRVVHPPDMGGEIDRLLKGPESLAPERLAEFVNVSADDVQQAFSFNDDLSHFKWALATAESYRDIGLHLWREEQPELLMVYIEGVDSSSHLFGHLFRQQPLEGELAEQQQRFGGTVEAMYLMADDLVGRYLDVMDEHTTLMVVSDHGFQLGELLDDPTKTRDMRRVSEKFHRRGASLFLYGHGVEAGTQWRDATTYDVTPTLLALAGLPRGEDMRGRVLREVLDPQVPVKTIASYETGADGDTSEGREANVDAAVLERLRSLGYLGTGTETVKNDRNLANILLREGEYRDAARAFKQLIDDGLGDAAVHTGFATALFQLNRNEQALEAFDQALELDPVFVPAYFNRALVKEKLGSTDEAIADYRTALRYDADHAGSRQALERLGVAAVGRVAESESEVRAAALLNQAKEAARRGDYEAADEALRQAAALVPGDPVILQYQSNVAYLQGDLETAIEILETALKEDPDNELLRRNLEGLLKRRQDGE